MGVTDVALYKTKWRTLYSCL